MSSMRAILSVHKSPIHSPKRDAQIDSSSVQEMLTYAVEAYSVVDMAQGFYSLYVYTNVVESGVFGGSVVSLLRIVPIECKHGDLVAKSFDNIQYVPDFHK